MNSSGELATYAEYVSWVANYADPDITNEATIFSYVVM